MTFRRSGVPGRRPRRVSLSDARGTLPNGQLLEMKRRACRSLIRLVYEEYDGQDRCGDLRATGSSSPRGVPPICLLAIAKRVTPDPGGRSLVLAAPVMALVRRGPSHFEGQGLYPSFRVGQHEPRFTVHKFRSMDHMPRLARRGVESGRADTPSLSWAMSSSSPGTNGRSSGNSLTKSDHELCRGPRPERRSSSFSCNGIPTTASARCDTSRTGWAQVRYTYEPASKTVVKLQYDLLLHQEPLVALTCFIIFSTLKTVSAEARRVTSPATAQSSRDDHRREDYFHVSFRRRRARTGGNRSRAGWCHNTRLDCLDLLAEHSGRATFFVTCWVAARHPALVGRAGSGRHESHRTDTASTRVRPYPHAFRDEVRRPSRCSNRRPGWWVTG